MADRRQIAYLESVRKTPHICLAEALRSANRAVSKRYMDHLATAGISAPQLSLLKHLYYRPEIPVTRLADDLETDRTTMTRNLDVLIRGGLVEIIKGGDRRERIVRLTEKGFAALEAALPHWRAAQQELQERLGPALWHSLMADFRTVAELDRDPSQTKSR